MGALVGDEGNGGISRLLRGRKQHDAAVPDSLDRAPSDDEVLTWFRRWQQAGGPVVEESVVADLVQPVPAELPSGLAVRSSTREVDVAWRRTSYSGLTRAADQQPGGVASEPEDAGLEDEAVEPVPTGGEPPVADALPSPMEGLPAGATFGSLVHAVLEEADPHAPDLAVELADKAREQLGFWPVDVTPDVLAEAMLAIGYIYFFFFFFFFFFFSLRIAKHAAIPDRCLRHCWAIAPTTCSPAD